MSTLHDILRYPHVTEKTTLKKELSDGRVIAFQVRPDASKRLDVPEKQGGRSVGTGR